MLHTKSQKACSFAHTSLTVNYPLFAQSDVSDRFNGKTDKVLLELKLFHYKFTTHEFSLSNPHINSYYHTFPEFLDTIKTCCNHNRN